MDHEAEPQMDHDGSNGMPMMMMMMQMWFTTSTSATILFKSWKTHNGWQLFLSMLVVIVFSILKQALTEYRRKVALTAAEYASSGRARPNKIEGKGGDFHDTANIPLYHGSHVPTLPFGLQWVTSSKYDMFILRMIDAFLHFVVTIMAFLNMLVAMTYNVQLFFAVCIGEGLGVLLFSSIIPWKHSTRHRTSSAYDTSFMNDQAACH